MKKFFVMLLIIGAGYYGYTHWSSGQKAGLEPLQDLTRHWQIDALNPGVYVFYGASGAIRSRSVRMQTSGEKR